MLTISPVQRNLISRPYRVEFLGRVRRFLDENMPRLVEQMEPELDRRIDRGLDKAELLNIESEQEQVMFVVLTLLDGPGFTESEPWAVATIDRFLGAGRDSGLVQELMDARKAQSAPAEPEPDPHAH